MSDASTMYETREAIEAHIAQAQRMRSHDRPMLAAFSPIGLYLGVAIAILLGVGVDAAMDRPDQFIDHGTTATLSREMSIPAQRSAAILAEPLGGTAGISHASAVLDFNEIQRRLCVTAESCHDVPPPAKKIDAVAQLTITP
jgi:hypothetical protein